MCPAGPANSAAVIRFPVTMIYSAAVYRGKGVGLGVKVDWEGKGEGVPTFEKREGKNEFVQIDMG